VVLTQCNSPATLADHDPSGINLTRLFAVPVEVIARQAWPTIMPALLVQ